MRAFDQNRIRSGFFKNNWLMLLIILQPLLDIIAFWTKSPDGTLAGVVRLAVMVLLPLVLLFRLPEALSVKMLTPFMLDPTSAGGLGLSTAQSGLVYGTVGVIALTVGGILGGIFAAKVGLRKALWPMALSLALPCAVYLYMAAVQPSQLWVVYLCVAFDQFGYGFGFTAYMLYLMHFSNGPYKTSHYAICTAFMALSMMIPGFFAGWLQQGLGYTGFFVLVMICCAATVAVTAFLVARIKE